MKTNIATTILTLATAFGFAQEAIQEQSIPNVLELTPIPKLQIVEEKVDLSKSFGYIRIGVSDDRMSADLVEQVVPGVGLGYRFESGFSAVDISASYNYRTNSSLLTKTKTIQYTLPKANYLFIATPASNNSFYAGAGAAWGGLITKDEREFHGLVPNVAVGYEMNRNKAWRSFVQLDVSQFVIATSQAQDLPGPFAELSIGAGF